jgi:hypothetical protein
MSFEHTRNIKDKAKIVTTALPAAGANVTSTAIDLEQVAGGQIEGVELELSVPATDTLVDNKSITFQVWTGATTTLAVADPLLSTTVTGTSGNASAAKVVRFRLPPDCLRYVGINASVPADAGTNTATDFTVSLLF